LTWAPSVRAQLPLDEFLASYPFGEHRAITATPDGARGFVAEGAGIAILDLTSLTPVTPLSAIQRVEVPHASPESLLYYRHPTPDPVSGVHRRWLFMAGGSLGVSRISLCEDLFQQPPITCSTSSFRWRLIDRPGSGTAFQWKRCVDVAIVEHPDAGPLLFALFAASSNPLKSAVGASEIAAYRLLPNGTTSFYARLQFTGLVPAPAHEYVATGLVPDPADPNTVYVSLGTAWLWRVSILHGTTPSFTTAPVAAPGISPCSMALSHPCPFGESMTDVTAIATATMGTIVFATLDYGRVLEYRIATGVVKEKRLWEGLAPNYSLITFPCRIDAIRADDDQILLAVACTKSSQIFAEGAAPYTSTGLWSSICLAPFIPDPNNPPGGLNGTQSTSVRILWSDPTGTTGPRYVGGGNVIPYGGHWGHLDLLSLGDWVFRLHVASGVDATSIYEIGLSASASASELEVESMALTGLSTPVPFFDWNLLATYHGQSIPASDGSLSEVNPNLILFGGERIGLMESLAQAEIVGSPPDILPVQQTHSACPASAEGFPGGACPSNDALKHITPNPFLASIFGSATWADPLDPTREWFLPGGENVVLVNSYCGAELDLCAFGDPCQFLPTPVRPLWRKSGLFPSGTDVGWYPVQLSPLASPLTGVSMQMKWWQFRSPSLHPLTRTEDVPYVFSTPDPRLADPDPEQPGELPFTRLVHAVRGGSDYGYKIFSPRDLMTRTAATCPSQPSGSTRGIGENIVPNPSQNPKFVEAMTHVELETPASTPTCVVSVPCVDPDHAGYLRNQANNKVHVFSLVKPEGVPGAGGTVWLSAVAAGFVTTGPSTSTGSTFQPPGCLWLPHHSKPMVNIYSLEGVDLDAGTTASPQLLRVLLGDNEGHAFAVRTAVRTEGTETRVYALVAEFTGRVLVFDISGDRLYTPTPPTTGTPYLPTHPILSPIPSASITFPKDPRDGYVPNCVDIEIEGNYAYCALTRGGVGIVDITDPTAPTIHKVIDTPGIVQGIAFHRPSAGVVQMVVGDSRAGLRLYGASGGGLSAGFSDEGETDSEEDAP